MRLAGLVALEAVLIATLLLTHFAIPSKLLQTLSLDSVADRLRGEKSMLRHRFAELGRAATYQMDNPV